MKQIKTFLALLCIVLAAASCSKETETGFPQTPADVAQFIRIAPFPAFAEGAQTRAIGTQDPGKTAWADGDVVLLDVRFWDEEGSEGNLQGYKLTYNNGTWTFDRPFYKPDYRTTTATISAYYAPDYEWEFQPALNNYKLTHKSGAVKGTSEYITYTATVTLADGITIDFAKPGIRPYSRLRIATVPNTQISVEFTNGSFTPVNGSPVSQFTLISNADGNAFLYGSWNSNTIISAYKDSKLLVQKTIPASTDGQSYALSAYSKADYDAVGNGTSEDPWQIWDVYQLQTMNKASATDSKIFQGKYFKLISDIDGKDMATFTPIGNYKTRFAGTFDGGGHTIRNLTLGTVTFNSPLASYSALFALTDGATISNLTLLDTKWSVMSSNNTMYMGALIGYTYSDFKTTITDCHVRQTTSDVALQLENTGPLFIGGLIGSGTNVSVQACSSEIPVSSNKFSGGLIGRIGGTATLIGCRTTGAVKGYRVGGLVGQVNGTTTTFVGCYASGAVSGTGTTGSGSYCGGFIGETAGATILSCYFDGSVSGESYKGSFVGGMIQGIISYSAATSNVGNQGIGQKNGTITITGEKLNCTPGELRGVMVDPAAETEWTKSEYDAIRTAVDNKSLSDIWVDVAGGAPKLWWEK